MGTLGLEALLPIAPVHTDDAHEIGALPTWQSATAMRIGLCGKDQTPVYLDETPIRVRTDWKIEDYMPSSEPEKEQRHRWWRVEIAADANHEHIRPGHDVVMAMHPYSSQWVHHAKFKRASHKGVDERPNARYETFDSSGELVKWVESHHHDYWAKGKVLTAGISNPDSVLALGRTLRDFQTNALYLFGTCDDFRTCERRLTEICVSKLRSIADKGYVGGRQSGQRVPLYPEVKPEANSLIFLSIRQALAGPQKSSGEFLEEPVHERVEQIYREHLNNYNRSVKILRQLITLFEQDGALEQIVDPESLNPNGGIDIEMLNIDAIKAKFSAGDLPDEVFLWMLDEIERQKIPVTDIKQTLNKLIESYRRGF